MRARRIATFLNLLRGKEGVILRETSVEGVGDGSSEGLVSAR